MSKLQLIFLVQNTGNLGMVIEHACKNAQPVKLISLANLGWLSKSGTKKGLKRICNPKNVSMLYLSKELQAIV